MTTDSPKPVDGETKRDPDALRLSLFDEVDAIEKLLEPLKGPELDSLRADLSEQSKRLESLSETDLASYKLQLLQKEIAKIKGKAEELVATPFMLTKSWFVEQLDDIQATLAIIEAAEPDVQDDARKKLKGQATDLKAKVEEIRDQLKPLEGSKLSSEKSRLQKPIDTLKEQADALAIRSFLLQEVRDIDRILSSARVGPLKNTEREFLQTEIANRRKRLESLGDEELPTFRRDISKLKERTEALAQRQSFFGWLRSFSVVFWLALIPYMLFVYMTYYSWWQSGHRAEIHDTATAYASAYPSPTIPPAASATPTYTETSTPTITMTLTPIHTATATPTFTVTSTLITPTQ